jgi:2-polyprenyl-3-methyl-5-hydroxy-6-metoxy-1,4-benzoquinol methylase
MITKNKDEHYYNLQNSRSGGDLDNNRLERFINNIEFQKTKDNIYIIDIGCRGHANMVRKLINLGFINTFGIDIGENAEKQWANYSFKNNLKQADIHEGIPFNYKFDLISCSHTLEHCYDPSLVMDVIKDNLVEGGYYWGQIPTAKSEDINNHAPHYCYFESHDDHINFIKSKGFEIIIDTKDSKQSLLLAKKI